MEDRSEVPSSLGAAGEVASTSDHETNMADGDNAYRYKKITGQATTKGQMFEIKFIMLLFLRLVNSELISEFHLASNVEGAGAIDDVVVKYKTRDNPHQWKSCFVQLKHKETKSLGIDQFKEENERGKPVGDFSLKKYLNSYIEIRKRIVESYGLIFEELQVEDSVFVIYTNAKLHTDLSKRKRTYCESEIDPFLKSKRPRLDRLPANPETESYGIIFNITNECDPVLFGYLIADEDTRFDAQEFLKALKVYSGQPSEKELDEIIKPELLKYATGLNEPDVHILYRSFLETVETWWTDSNSRTLTRNSGMLKKTLGALKLNSLSSQSITQYKLDISFLENCHFPSNRLDADKKIKTNSLVHIVSPALCVKLSCTKLLQSLPNDYKYMFLSLDDLLKNTDAVKSTWPSWQYSCLVIVSESDGGQEELCNILCARLQDENVEKKEAQKAHKIIIVSAQDDAFSANLKKGFNGRVTEVPDSFQLTQLENDSKERINNGSVLFQEQKIILRDLLAGGADLETRVLNDNLVQNILNRTDIVIGPKLETTVPYYIPRTIIRYDILSKDVLKEEHDAFIVHGITETNLQKLVPSQETVGLVGVEGDINKCRFFVIGSGSTKDTSEVYRRKHNVHELKMSPEGTLRWVQSKGSFDCIKKHIDVKHSGSSCPETVMDFDSRVTLLEASPGMGKSTFVTHLATETKRIHPLTWVIRINLSQHMELFKTCEDGTQFLESALRIDKKTTTERALFRHSMETKGNVVGILDGCDEVAPQYTEKCLTLISSLQKTKLSKIIVTTRHSLKSKIEKRVTTSAFNLHPFTKENQETFFRKYCKHQSDTLKVQGVVQEQVVKKFLNQMEESLNNEEKEFLGIPLHAMMLAEIYQDSVHNPDFQISEKLSLLYIFKKVIDKKFCIYINKKIPGADNVDFIKETLINKINHDHMYAALVLLLSKTQLETFDGDMKSEIIEGNNKLMVTVEDGKNNTGIVDKFLNNKAIFIHRTFAEYFAALWFSKNYKKCRGFLQIFIYTEEFKVVRRFFDLLLASNSDFLTSVINNDGPTIRTLMKGNVNAVDNGGRSALHLAASFGFDCKKIKPVPKHMQEHEHLVDCLLKEGADFNVKDDVFERTAMDYAMNLMSWDVIDMLINHYSKEKIRVWLNQLTKRNGIEVRRLWSGYFWLCSSLVHQAAAYGHINIVKAFLAQRSRLHESGILPRTIKSIIYLRDDHNSTPLHEACLHNQSRVAAALIASLRTNTNAITRYINTKNMFGWSALHYACRHGGPELIEYLVSNRANIWALNRDNRTPLFATCEKNNVAAAKALIASLGPDSAARTRYINMEDKNGVYAFHRACYCGGPELIEYLVSNGANLWALNRDNLTPLFFTFYKNNVAATKAVIAGLGPDSAAITRYINMEEKDGESALHYACTYGDPKQIEYLVSNGANIWALNRDNQTPLFGTCWKSNVAAAKALIASLGPDSAAITRYINMQDKDGEFVLHRACEHGGPDLIEYLVSNGANIWALDEANQTPLFVTWWKNDVAAAKALIASLGPDSAAITRYINMQDKDGESALHLAYRYGGPELIEHLVANGANIWALNRHNRTPLFVTCVKNNVAAAKALIASLGPDSAAITRYINMEDKHGESVLHLACRHGDAELIEYLVSSGANIWALDEDDRTALFTTCEENNVAAAKAPIASLGPDSAAITRYINMEDEDGDSALNLACERRGPELTEYLISNGANIWAVDEDNQTPLFATCRRNDVAAAKGLIASLGPDSVAITRYINMQDKFRQSALHYACRHGGPELTEYLVSNGANIWALDEDNGTPLFVTCVKNNVAAAKALIASLGWDSAAITRYINMEDEDGVSALRLACEHGGLELTEYLISNGANIWALDKHNRTPLFATCLKNSVAAAKALIASLGLDSAVITRYINMQDKDGVSGLHRACEHGGLELIEYLVSNGANIWTLDKHNHTPLFATCEENNVAAAKVLIASLGLDLAVITRYINMEGKGGVSVLHRACEHGGPEVIEYLVSNGANIWALDKHNTTPLFVTCLENNVAAAKALIASLGPDSAAITRYINMQDKDGVSALHRACEHGGPELIEYLVSNGANIWALDKHNTTPLFVTCVKNNVAAAKALIASLGQDSAALTRYIEKDVLNGESILHHACRYGDPELIEYLVSIGANIWAPDENSQTPLFVICRRNNVAASKALIASLGPDSAAITRYVNMQDENGRSVLHRACLHGGPELIEYLVSNGANIWALDRDNQTPLFFSCLRNKVASAKALIASLGPDSAALTRYINTDDKDGDSVLHLACRYGDPELIEYLVSNGANIWELDEDSQTPLFVTCRRNNVAAAKALIASLGPDSAAITRYINMQDKDGVSVLHRACWCGGPELIEYLVSNGANIWALDEDNRTPLFATCEKNNVAAAKALIASLGPDPAAITQYINMEDKHGVSVLHRACELGGLELIEYLVSNRANIWALNRHNRTPLFVTCWENDVAAAKALIASLGPDSAAITRYINMEDKHGVSVLHHACRYGDPELIEYLVSNRANIRALNRDSQTPLFATCEKNDVAAAKALIASLGSDSAAITRYFNTEDKHGESVLHRACEHGGPELIEYLGSNGANIWALDEDNHTPLFATCLKNNVAAAKALIASLGPNSAAITQYINRQDKDGESALHYACRHGGPELTEHLVSNGANIWALDKDNQTPLFVTCQGNEVAAAKALIASLGPDSAAITRYINMQDKDGESALVIANRSGHVELTEYLISRGGDIDAHHETD